MSAARTKPRQRAVMATDSEWERVSKAAAAAEWDDACAAVDAWLEREGDLGHLTDPGAANRWKAATRPDMGEGEPS